jgi:hypothetical protein
MFLPVPSFSLIFLTYSCCSFPSFSLVFLLLTRGRAFPIVPSFSVLFVPSQLLQFFQLLPHSIASSLPSSFPLHSVHDGKQGVYAVTVFQAWVWQDEWAGLTMEDIRKIGKYLHCEVYA